MLHPKEFFGKLGILLAVLGNLDKPGFAQIPASYGEHLPRLAMIEETLANLPYEKFCRDQGVFGDAAEVVDRLQAARDEFGLSQIICWFDQGSMLPRREVEHAMRRFAEEVMPRLA